MRKYILKAIIKRDLKEIFRNPQTLIIFAITVGINIFLSVGITKSLWTMTFVMTLVMFGFSITSFMITEENDKKTLEALLVSPASYNEVLFGKLFLTYSLTVCVSLGLILSLHYGEISTLHTLIAVPIGALVICLFGVVIGLICPSQAVLSGIGTLLMLLLFIPELLASTNEYIGHLARALPTHHVVQVAHLGREEFSSLMAKHYGVLLLSLGATVLWARSFIQGAPTQEGKFWKFSKQNKILSGVLLLTLLLSSFTFIPPKGEIKVVSDEKSEYINEEFGVSAVFNSKKMTTKEYRLQEKYLVMFTLKEDKKDYIYLGIKKNYERLSTQDSIEKIKNKLSGKEIMKLNIQEITSDQITDLFLISYESSEGKELYYAFNDKRFLYRVGVESREKNYLKLRNTLDQFIKEVKLLK